jgi:hypothetical protein
MAVSAFYVRFLSVQFMHPDIYPDPYPCRSLCCQVASTTNNSQLMSLSVLPSTTQVFSCLVLWTLPPLPQCYSTSSFLTGYEPPRYLCDSLLGNTP